MKQSLPGLLFINQNSIFFNKRSKCVLMPPLRISNQPSCLIFFPNRTSFLQNQAQWAENNHGQPICQYRCYFLLHFSSMSRTRMPLVRVCLQKSQKYFLYPFLTTAYHKIKGRFMKILSLMFQNLHTPIGSAIHFVFLRKIFFIQCKRNIEQTVDVT